MIIDSFVQLQDAVTAAWGADTCDPVDLSGWSSANRARGQCGVTALVLQDLLGGELVVAEVMHADRTRQGVHYWNRLGCVELDLTRGQFVGGEQIGTGEIVQRKPGGPTRCLAQYLLLRRRVFRTLQIADSRR